MELFSTSVDLGDCGILHASFSLDSKILEVSSSLAKLIGQSASELAGKDFSEIFLSSPDAQTHPSQLAPVIDKLQKTSNQSLSFSYQVNGRSYEVKTWLTKPAPEGSSSNVQCLFFDITAQKETEQKLNEKNELIDSMFKASLDAIIIADAEGRILEWGGKAEEIFGWQASEVIGQFMHEYIIPKQYREAHLMGMRRFNTTGEIRILNKRIEITALRKSGEEFPVELTIARIFSDSKALFCSFLRDITDRKKSESEIWQQANFDALTGLPNRRMFENHLAHEIKLAKRMGNQFGLLFIDLDHFKGVNDSFGHSRGDELLKLAATRLLHCTRESDMVARLGGDEFVILLDSVHNKISTEEIARKIKDEIAKPFVLDGRHAYVSASIGITVFPIDGETTEELMNNADQAMYEAKNSGRNTVSHFTSQIKEKSNTKISLANNLQQALPNRELEIHYQPIVNLRSGKIHKVEALLRWHHPQLGFVSPQRFIPISEELGLIFQIGQWLDENIGIQLKRWQQRFGDDFQISVNKSPIQFIKDTKAHHRWINGLAKHGLAGHNLCIEITEGLLLNPEPIVYEKIEAYRTAGVEIAIDDFGTGYSSLLYLKDFHIDILKIDRLFIVGINKNSKEAILCEGIIAMAHKLGIKVVAEGIETEFQREFLKQSGCDYGQGYIFSVPLSADDFETFMSDRSAG